jgi:hypothetical protein
VVDILDEVLNDEKDEKRLALFRSALPTIIVATIFIAVAMAGYGWYKNRIVEHNKEIGDMFIDLASGEVDDVSLRKNSLNQLIENGKTRQAELAEIQLIRLMLLDNDPASSMTRLESVIENNSYFEITTSYAKLLWLGLILDQSELTEVMQTKARNYLDHFSKEDQLFFASATILKSLFYKKNGQDDLATEYASSILKMESASIILKEQALAILASLKNKKVDK